MLTERVLWPPKPPMRMSRTKRPAEQERYHVLAEELGEAVATVGKLLRHGPDSFNPHEHNGISNRRAVELELGDVLGIIMLMDTAGDIDMVRIRTQAIRKIESVEQWMHHQPRDLFERARSAQRKGAST